MSATTGRFVCFHTRGTVQYSAVQHEPIVVEIGREHRGCTHYRLLDCLSRSSTIFLLSIVECLLSDEGLGLQHQEEEEGGACTSTLHIHPKTLHTCAQTVQVCIDWQRLRCNVTIIAFMSEHHSEVMIEAVQRRHLHHSHGRCAAATTCPVRLQSCRPGAPPFSGFVPMARVRSAVGKVRAGSFWIFLGCRFLLYSSADHGLQDACRTISVPGRFSFSFSFLVSRFSFLVSKGRKVVLPSLHILHHDHHQQSLGDQAQLRQSSCYTAQLGRLGHVRPTSGRLKDEQICFRWPVSRLHLPCFIFIGRW